MTRGTHFGERGSHVAAVRAAPEPSLSPTQLSNLHPTVASALGADVPFTACSLLATPQCLIVDIGATG
jgi:hypothetical protein